MTTDLGRATVELQRENRMSNDYVRIGINNVLQSEVRDIKKALSDGDIAKAAKKVDELEKKLRSLTAFL
ncbi:hypothetical protein MNR02_08755 [Shinella sp. H4-D48]|uniref:hypothetical protein n=1 Tax=Shinella sp. H4-D48 TaxID=2925841 RepID=UPI001F53E088|nr:hypothetical protein [Shinella sp. H4-D48]UNK36603.1 hypothetical protein MNR02_08755 [Shinella sp. H4-D48]